MSSIACKKLEEFPHQSQAIQEALRLFLQMEIRWMDVDYLQVVNLAVATGLTVYDASYLYVSRELNIP